MATEFQSLSVGSLVQKLITTHPELGIEQLIAIVKQSVERQGRPNDGFSGAETLNESKAFEIARATVAQLQARPL